MNHTPANSPTDAFIERIVREVIRRLLAMQAQQGGTHRLHGSTAAVSATTISAPHPVSQKLITAATLETIPIGTTEVLIPNRAVVTPLARDEAKIKGIRLTRAEPTHASQPGTPQ